MIQLNHSVNIYYHQNIKNELHIVIRLFSGL